MHDSTVAVSPASTTCRSGGAARAAGAEGEGMWSATVMASSAVVEASIVCRSPRATRPDQGLPRHEVTRILRALPNPACEGEPPLFAVDFTALLQYERGDPGRERP